MFSVVEIQEREMVWFVNNLGTCHDTELLLGICTFFLLATSHTNNIMQKHNIFMCMLYLLVQTDANHAQVQEW